MVFTLEMSPVQLVQRLACSWAGVSLLGLQRGKLDQEAYARFVHTIGEINEWPVSLHTGEVTPGVIQAKVQRAPLQSDVDLVVVDYLGLMALDQAQTAASMAGRTSARCCRIFARAGS